MSRLLVVYNQHAGTAPVLDDIKQAFARHGEEPEYIAITAKQLHRKVHSAIQQHTTIIAAGGDGTISTVAGLVQGTSSPLGIIPTGTLNHFAKTLHIPIDITKSIAVIVAGKHRHVDIGTINHHAFINNSSIGFYPQSLRTRAAYSRHIGKWPAACIGFVRAAIRPRRYRVEISIDGKQLVRRTPFVFIGNNPYKRTPPDVSDRPALDTGQLAIYVVKATQPLAIIRLLAHALFTRKRRTKDFEVYHTSACTIRTRRHKNLKVSCDGEVLTLAPPLHYRCQHKKLRVIAP